MIDFKQLFLEARKPKSEISAKNIEYVKTQPWYNNAYSASWNVQNALSKLSKKIAQYNIELDKPIAEYLLSDLEKILKKHGISNLYQNLKRGRKTSHNTTQLADLDYLSAQQGSQATHTDVIAARKQLLKRLRDEDRQAIDTETASLEQLEQYIKTNNVPEYVAKRKRDWETHEKEIAKGINQLFKTGFFHVISNGTTHAIIDNKSYKAMPAGGSIKSDIMVKHNDKSFYVEAKYDFDTSNYFKFGLDIDNYSIKYDHEFHLRGEVKKDPKLYQYIDTLFKSIDLSGYLNKLLAKPEIKKFWKQFVDNIKELETYLKTHDEFKQFMKKPFSSKYPEAFKDLAHIFDKYCDYYIERYNTLISALAKYITNIEVVNNIDKYKISAQSSAPLEPLNDLIAALSDKYGKLIDVTDKKQFNSIIKTIKTIEIKFTVLLKHLKHDSADFNEIDRIKNDTSSNSKKLQYFFAMFISSVKRKKPNKTMTELLVTDDIGTKHLIPTIEIEDNQLNKMITDYYVKKDNCAYIQIDDVIFQFDKKFNPLNIEKLPIFNDLVTKYSINITVNRKLSEIRLLITAHEPDLKTLQNKLSFKINDSNYIANKLNFIDVTID